MNRTASRIETFESFSPNKVPGRARESNKQGTDSNPSDTPSLPIRRSCGGSFLAIFACGQPARGRSLVLDQNSSLTDLTA